MRSTLAVLMVATLGVACAKNPVSGKREIVLVSEAQEIELGRSTARQVKESLGHYEEPGLSSYVSELGLRLARGSERPHLPWEFHVLDSPVVNAFALPGGFIYLTRGILAHMNNEAALVGVLGHEIGHVTARHSVQQISRAQLAGLGLGVGLIFVPEVRPFGDLLETGLGLMFLKFGRDDERQSDQLGVRYSRANGYDPREMAFFFDVLSRQGERSGGGIPSWLSTHPDPEERKGRILELASATGPPVEPLVVAELEFKRRIEGMIFGENPRQGFVEGSRFLHPDLRFQIDFPAGWKIENTRQAVYAAPLQGDAALQLTASRTSPGARPDEHARAFFQRHGLRYGDVERLRVDEFSAYRATFEARSGATALTGEAGFVTDGETVYEILGYTRPQSFRRYRPAFLACLQSFSRLRDPRALAAEARRIALYRVRQAAPLAQVLKEAGFDRPEDLETLALLNNLRLSDDVPSGSLLKVLTTGAGSSG
jgi:predicted Zn-dependent protease